MNNITPKIYTKLRYSSNRKQKRSKHYKQYYSAKRHLDLVLKNKNKLLTITPEWVYPIIRDHIAKNNDANSRETIELIDIWLGEN